MLYSQLLSAFSSQNVMTEVSAGQVNIWVAPSLKLFLLNTATPPAGFGLSPPPHTGATQVVSPHGVSDATGLVMFEVQSASAT